MKAHDAIKFTIETSSHVVQEHLKDLNDAELLHRPAPGCNHINWQLGHLIAGEHNMISEVFPGALPALPAGFAEKYTSEKSKSDDPALFCTKAELLEVHQQQRAAGMAVLEKTSEQDLDMPCSGWTPNVGALFVGSAGAHWLMHVGQWSVVRRELGRPPLF